jgi:hypothetical protein
MLPLLLVTTLLGAAPSEAAAVVEAPAERRLGLTAAYLGEEVVHPGGQLGVEYTLGHLAWLSFLAGANLGGFVHPRYVVGLYLDAELGVRATTSGGFLVDVLGDVGYLHLFPDGTVYEVPSPGAAPVVVANLGRPAFRFGGTLGLGADLSRTGWRLPLSIVLRLGAFGETRFTGGVLLHPQALLGVCWALR